jgi:hypothetical protein
MSSSVASRGDSKVAMPRDGTCSGSRIRHGIPQSRRSCGDPISLPVLGDGKTSCATAGIVDLLGARSGGLVASHGVHRVQRVFAVVLGGSRATSEDRSDFQVVRRRGHGIAQGAREACTR